MFSHSIIIIDDEEPITELVKATLEDRYNVATTTSGYSGIKFMKDNKIDLVLLDIKMPNMNGLVALEEIKKRHPDVIVIMLTAYASSDNMEKAKALGAYGFISKPFDVDELRSCIAQAINTRVKNKNSVPMRTNQGT